MFPRKTFPKPFPVKMETFFLFWVNVSSGSTSVGVMQAKLIWVAKLVGDVGFPEVTGY